MNTVLGSCLAASALILFASTTAGTELEQARDRQDRQALEKIAENLSRASQQKADADSFYRSALAQSYLAQVGMELGDKAQAKAAAESGIRSARRAIALKPNTAEYHRILGTLCGQVIPANVLAGLKYGRCARDEINKAIELDPDSSDAYLSRGVGNYYLPAAFGGGVELAIRDFHQAIKLNPNSAEAHLWLGIALRKAKRNAEARQEFAKSLSLNPNRLWAKQQLDKTPAQ
jgi:tetratricopeptide (TPR) repeat protein